MRIAEQGSDQDVAQGLQTVADCNADKLEPHLQHEEQAILRDLIQQHPEHTQLCITIGKEHGYLRTLVEEMRRETGRRDLAEFGRVLHSHTLLEDRALFPLVEDLFTPEQMSAIEGFAPFQQTAPIATRDRADIEDPSADGAQWLAEVRELVDRAGRHGGSIVLLPRFSPEHVEQMARHLGLRLFDFQREVLADFGAAADSVDLALLERSLRERAQGGGIVSHNVEALLSVQSEPARRAWLGAFLAADWPNPVLLPVTLYQGDVPEGHERVCDLELHKMPRRPLAYTSSSMEHIKYEMDER